MDDETVVLFRPIGPRELARISFADRYPVQVVGARWHQELWVPADELDAFNENIVGEIELIATYRGAEGSAPVEVAPDARFHEE